MGQYYFIINVDKKQYLHAHKYDNGLKLMEWSWVGNRLSNKMAHLMKKTWKGDRVYVVGDYADLEDYEGDSKNWHDTYARLVDEFGIMDGDYKSHPDSYSMFAYAGKNFKHIYQSKQYANAKLDIRYIYNHATHQVIDLKECPEDENGWQIFPLSLLLAMGNGRGGGDYYHTNPGYDLVGSWCGTSEYIEVTDEPLDGCNDYERFNPCFMEW